MSGMKVAAALLAAALSSCSSSEPSTAAVESSLDNVPGPEGKPAALCDAGTRDAALSEAACSKAVAHRDLSLSLSAAQTSHREGGAQTAKRSPLPDHKNRTCKVGRN